MIKLTKYINMSNIVIILVYCFLPIMVTFPNFAVSREDNTTQKPQKRKSTDFSASPKTRKNQKKGDFLEHKNFYLTLIMYMSGVSILFSARG